MYEMALLQYCNPFIEREINKDKLWTLKNINYNEYGYNTLP